MNKQNRRIQARFALLLITVLHVSFVRSQDYLKEITESFNKYRQQNLPEKIYAHTDKTYYLAGEIIWFKLYVVDAGFQRPLDLSKVGYVEILDAANKPVLQAKTAIDSGSGNGSFFIPLNISSGNYKFRAYTNWMKNFGTEFFFEKNITVVNTQKTVAAVGQDTLAEYDVRFFPEGGNLVSGLKSKVAFKAVDRYGKSFDFVATLLDNNKPLLKFEPSHAGMGSFSFTPQRGHNYEAVITLPSGSKITKDIPSTYSAGYVMTLENTAQDKMTVQVHSTGLADSHIFLLVYNNAGIKEAERKTMQNGNAVFTINKSDLEDGISYLTLFNTDKRPVCERLYFKKPVNLLSVALNTDQEIYTERNKVNLSVTVNNTTGSDDFANLSMSVYKIDSLQSADDNTIEAYMLLGSALRGTIETPSYYFSNSRNETDIDNLLLTQGWRKFNWDKLFKNEKPVFSFIPEYNGHIITGRVINSITGKRQASIESFLSVPGTRLQFYPFTSDSDGVVKFEMKDFYGSSEIAVQAGTQFDSIYRIEISNPFSEAYSATKLPSFQVPAQSPNTLIQKSIAMQVQNIYSTSNLRRFLLPSNDTSTFFLHPDKTYLLDDYTRFKTLEEVLREYVALVNVAKKDGLYHFPVYNDETKEFYQVDPLNLLDGVPVFNLNKFLEVDPLQIRKLDVIHQRYIYGGSSFSGILNWTTYKGDLANYKPDPSTVVLDYEALQLQREFYSPLYDTEEKRNSRLPDFRNVLSWSPEIKIKTATTQQLSFYTSDLAGKYAVQIQGFSSKGACGSKTIFINVEK